MQHGTGRVNGGKFMSGTNKLGTFCTLFNADSWKQYQAEVQEMLLSANSTSESKVAFPTAPKGYPCLVAASYKPADATKANEFTYFRVECCFVYLNDAHRLLDAAASVDDSIIVEDEVSGIAGLLHPDGPRGNAVNFDAVPGASPAEADLTILVFAMLKELHGIGAIKFERLQEELPRVQSALEAYGSAQSDKPVDLSEFVASLWGHVNVD